MSEETTPNGDDGQQAEPEGTTEPQVEAAPPAGDDKPTAAEAEAARWKKRARANEDQLKALRKQVKELVDPQQVATVESQLAETTATLTAAQTEATRWRVALETGLPPDLAARLVGTTEDEMRDDATKLKTLLGKQSKGAAQAQRASGPQTSTTQPTDLNALLRQAAGKG